jgi:hypothetical protein
MPEAAIDWKPVVSTWLTHVAWIGLKPPMVDAFGMVAIKFRNHFACKYPGTPYVFYEILTTMPHPGKFVHEWLYHWPYERIAPN